MNAVVLAALAAGVAVGVLLALAGLTGRRVLEWRSGFVSRLAGFRILLRLLAIGPVWSPSV